jgi:hypothetical protein
MNVPLELILSEEMRVMFDSPGVRRGVDEQRFEMLLG